MANVADDKEEDDDEEENSNPCEDSLSPSLDLPVVIDDNKLWVKVNTLWNADSFDKILSCVSDAGMLCLVLSLTTATTNKLFCETSSVLGGDFRVQLDVNARQRIYASAG